MSQEIMVSVFCVTYNHREFIREALEGFVMQKTNFRFEVLIHDDASTDGTTEIVREYAEKCPDIFKPIYQTENQYSKGVRISNSILVPKAVGKYFAWCEGDDRWTDPLKLQKQFDFMESHPEHSLCLHRTVKHWCTPGGEDSVGPEQEADRDYSMAEVMSRQHFFSWASVFIRAELYRNMPKCFGAKTCGDIPCFIYSSIVGKVHCLQDSMAVYNYRHKGSFTRRFFDDHKNKIAHNRDVIAMLKNVDKYYDYKYTKELAEGIRYHEYHLYKHTGEWERINGSEYDAIRDRDKQRIARLDALRSDRNPGEES